MECILALKTLTAAMELRRALIAAGMAAPVVALPREISSQGCAQGISIPREQLSRAEELARRVAAGRWRVFCMQGDGYREVRG